MTATNYIDVGNQTYSLTTNVGSGRVRVGYREGPLIAVWDPVLRNPWVVSYEGFDSFLRGGHMWQLLEYLKKLDLKRRGQSGSPVST